MGARSPTHVAALEYARRGWHVFPIAPPIPGDRESGKHPIGSLTPRGKDDATIDLARIDDWWWRYPMAGVAISLAPSELVVLDVDVGVKKDGTQKRGRESLAALDTDCGGLESTLTAVTGGGGLHAYYQADRALASASRLGFRDGLDLIVSGYVVAPPSAHYSGNPYRWSDTRAPAKLPERLARAAEVKRKSPADFDRGVNDRAKAGSTGAPIEEGSRNVALFRLGCALRDLGIGANALKLALDAENRTRFSPPMDDEEVVRVAESVMRRVQPTRDVAAGAEVEVIAREVQTTGPAVWLEEAARVDQPPARAYATGFAELDALLNGGLWTRQVCGVIGPPSCGKSAFVDTVAEHISKSIPVLHVSTELPQFELVCRKGAQRGGFPWLDALRGTVPQVKVRELVGGSNTQIIGCDDVDRSDPIAQIRNAAANLYRLRGVPPLVIIDYVQLLARGSADQTRSKVGELTMQIRQLSQALDCPVLAVFATPREYYRSSVLDKLREADDPTAYLAAAKESGDIEFDCATILFLDVDKLHEGLPKPARIAVARCRVGDIGFAGARAQLDVGKWWGDPLARIEMSADQRAERRADGQISKDDERVLHIMTRMDGRTWTEIRACTGLQGRRADEARRRLIEAKRIELVNEPYYDGLGRRKYREIIRVVGASPTEESRPWVRPIDSDPSIEK